MVPPGLAGLRAGRDGHRAGGAGGSGPSDAGRCRPPRAREQPEHQGRCIFQSRGESRPAGGLWRLRPCTQFQSKLQPVIERFVHVDRHWTCPNHDVLSGRQLQPGDRGGDALGPPVFHRRDVPKSARQLQRVYEQLHDLWRPPGHAAAAARLWLCRKLGQSRPEGGKGGSVHLRMAVSPGGH